MLRSLTSSALSIVLLLVAACGDDDVPDADAGIDAGMDGPASDVCARLGAAICGGVDACCAEVPLPFDDGAACAAAAAERCREAGTTELAALASGTARVDEAALEACATAWATGADVCRVPSMEVQAMACRGVFVAAAEVGGACAEGLGGLRCAGGEGLCFPEPTGVSCRAWATPGQACAEAPCPPWLHCMPGDGGLVCDARREIGGRCEAPIHCREGLRCDGGRCAAGLPTGERCRSFECGDGLVCDPVEERCLPGAMAGERCFTPLHCADGLACVGLETGLVCVPGEPGDGDDAPGLPGFLEPCSDRCARGFVCAEGPVPGRCAANVCAF
ncbi:MAG: hypothetical protein KF901_00425 [Myxococcales bacterium]|nr:hypothetical protein [Myxococcales bacterium]